MPLTDKERNKIEYDAIVSRRLKEIQNIANNELEISFWESQKIKNQDTRAESTITLLRRKISFMEGIVKKADEFIEKYEKDRDSKGS